ncbi:hypothetical protein PISMIDRAFT_540455 [Pisolithus microcarpus 441]|uniref:Secreted protein n=1 Tax=Pisolithus microcarpus 441 TaxID=765257 RepID=A0A0C9YA07_9AGAM|nr:hypothetical protein BKA83DRAFT_540455 [Pisolithus microcarpus]KIK21495.1 hypothetical protein PISMIDRAFT_540455 [Pisolithus microcarpus 441]
MTHASIYCNVVFFFFCFWVEQLADEAIYDEMPAGCEMKGCLPRLMISLSNSFFLSDSKSSQPQLFVAFGKHTRPSRCPRYQHKKTA